jgi:hypothetical protein
MNGRRCKPVYGFQLPSGTIKAGFIAGIEQPGRLALDQELGRANRPHEIDFQRKLRNSLVRACCRLAKNSAGVFASMICPAFMKTMRSATSPANPISGDLGKAVPVTER